MQDDRHADRDRAVGDIKDRVTPRVVMDVDEIDDAAAHDPVEQVARRAPHDQRKGGRHYRRTRAAREQHPEHHHRDGGEPVEHSPAHGRRQRREQAERGARIQRVGYREPVRHHVDLFEELEMPDDVELDQLIEDENRQRDETEHRAKPAPVGRRAHTARGRCRRLRRNRPHALSACTTARHRGSRSEPESSSKYIQQRWHLRPGARRPTTTSGGSVETRP